MDFILIEVFFENFSDPLSQSLKRKHSAIDDTYEDNEYGDFGLEFIDDDDDDEEDVQNKGNYDAEVLSQDNFTFTAPSTSKVSGPMIHVKVPLNETTKRFIPQVSPSSSVKGELSLPKDFTGLLKGQLSFNVKPMVCNFTCNDPDLDHILEIVNYKLVISHPSIKPLKSRYVVVKHMLSEIANLRHQIGCSLMLAVNLFEENKGEEESLNKICYYMISPIAGQINSLLQLIKRLRATIIPGWVPSNIKSPVINSPIKSKNIWEIDQSIMKPLVEWICKRQSKRPFRGFPNRTREGFRGRFRGSRRFRRGTSQETKK